MIRQHHRGFTLIEIMVVVTIIGIMTGLIAVSMITTDPQKLLNREALRFKTLVEMAQEEALFSQQEIGIIVNENSYKFARWEVVAIPIAEEEDGSLAPKVAPTTTTTAIGIPGSSLKPVTPPPKWNLINDEKEFRQYQLDENFEIILEVDQEEIDLNAGKDPAKQQAKAAKDILVEEEELLEPSIFILSSGELSPFVMEFYSTEDNEITTTVSADESGKVWIGDEEDEDEDR